MNVTVLASGSKGNCTYIEGDSGALLIDAGLSCKEIFSRIESAGLNKDIIKGILVTHEHTDHIKGIDVTSRKLGVPVIATQGTLWEIEEKRTHKIGDKLPQLIKADKNEIMNFEDFKIMPFAAYHDALDPCGFTIAQSDSRFGFCTDTGQLDSRMENILMQCDTIVLESNHCPVMLENGPYPYFLKERIRDPARGHLSNTKAADFIRKTKGCLDTIILAHLSEENNTPETALGNAREAACGFESDTDIEVSLQWNPLKTIEI